MPDPFCILPLPLPIFILNGLEDLGTLHYLLQASPAANILFAQYYCEVTEAIFSNFVTEFRQLLRVVVSIRSQPDHVRALCNSLEAFDAFRITRIKGPCAGAAIPGRPRTTLAAARSLARTASQVQRLSTSFFATHFERINSIRPYRTEMRMHWDPKWDRGETELDLVRYHVCKSEEQSWVEEQRLLRALWRVVVYLDVQYIIRPYEGQQSELWDTLATEGPIRVWLWLGGDGKHDDRDILFWDLQELECIMDFLVESSGIAIQSKHRAAHLQRLPLIEVDSFNTPKTKPCGKTNGGNGFQLPGELWHSSPGYLFWCVTAHADSRYAIEGLDFKPFRFLGLGIWDNERLLKLGLA